METVEPKLILVFSGKRKSGKDYVTDLIHKRLGPDACCILRLSGPLKQQYALEHSLDFGELLGASEYKEKYRADMIQWGERQRERDPGFFCRLATRGAQQPVWMISDARRLSDVQWFWREYPSQTRCVRVHASQQTRADRGWVFTADNSPRKCRQLTLGFLGIDDAESECGLDSNVEFDWTIRNEADAPPLNEQLQLILSLAETAAGLKQTIL